MEIIPAINCFNETCFLKKINIVRKKLKQINWLQIDINDGKFTNAPKSYYDLNILKRIQKDLKIKLEIHLMVKNLKEYLNQFLFANRLIIHLEVIEEENSYFSEILELSAENNFELMLALKKETDFERIKPFLDSIFYIQFLGVKAGFSNQVFDKNLLKKIKDFHELYPDVFIEVDGGINFDNINSIKEAGAEFFVIGSNIFDQKNPEKQYQKFKELINLIKT